MTAISPSASGADGGTAVIDEDRAPRRADGVELLGELPGSGYRTAPSLVRRADGQTLQVTPLLYATLAEMDGQRRLPALAEAVSRRTGRQVGVETLRLLLGQLEPLGVLQRADGASPPLHRADPLLGLRFRYVVTDPEVTRRITAPFAVLFHWPVVAVALLAFATATGWVLFDKGLGAPTAQAFDSPGLLLLVFVMTLLSAGFHEFGHAAACRYGGATPGAMGAGLYLVWPAFYTDVTDSYRLGRAGRVRVDLGGLYFNALFAVAVVGVWLLVRHDALLLVVLTQVLQMVRQLAPLVRFDGYHVLADLTGVPDLYARIGPTLRNLLPWHWRRREPTGLRPWAQVVVTVWVLVVVPLLLGVLATAVLVLPRILATTWSALQRQQAALAADWSAVDPAGIAVRLLSMVALVLPLLGLLYLLLRIVRRAWAWAWGGPDGSPARRAVALGTACLVALAVGWAWWPDDNTYRPITEGERLTVIELLPAVASAQTGLREGTTGKATTVWASAPDLPTRDEPVLALVLVPRDGSGPAWVFPFDAPAAPGEGDNQALALATEDGSTVYDVAFALVWVTDGAVDNRNEAYAFASCTGCTAVSVGFQVVLALGQSDAVAPQSISAAVNYSCVHCLAYALASQLVVALPDGLSPDATAELQALWAEMEAFGASVRDVPLDQLQARLEEYKARILEVVEQDAAAQSSSQAETVTGTPSASPSSTASPTGTPTPTATATATPSPTSLSTSTPSPSPTPSSSPTATATPTTSPSPSVSPSVSGSPS